MTRHGTTTLDALIEDEDNPITYEQVFSILNSLTTILEDVHNTGYVHNDLKSN